MSDLYEDLDPMDLYEDEFSEHDEGEIIGYYCLGCGWEGVTNGFAGTCPCCMGASLEEIYE